MKNNYQNLKRFLSIIISFSFICSTIAAQDNHKKISWCAIGDSFTYLNDHLNETGNKVKKGYLSRTCDKISFLSYINMGKNGSTTQAWVNHLKDSTWVVPKADLYTILLGTNDWNHGDVTGTTTDFKNCTPGSVLGNMGIIVSAIHNVNANAKVILINPTERGQFVYLLKQSNNAEGGWFKKDGGTLKEFSSKLYQSYLETGIPCLDLYSLCGFNFSNIVKYKHVKLSDGSYKNLSYPEYTNYKFDSSKDEYPYPLDAMNMTYDGLHPSDYGNEIIATLLSKKILEILNIRQ